MTARYSQAGKVNLTELPFTIISNVPFSASPQDPRAFTGLAERTQAFTHSRNAHTPTLTKL